MNDIINVINKMQGKQKIASEAWDACGQRLDYEGRIHWYKLNDLPIPPGKETYLSQLK